MNIGQGHRCKRGGRGGPLDNEWRLRVDAGVCQGITIDRQPPPRTPPVRPTAQVPPAEYPGARCEVKV